MDEPNLTCLQLLNLTANSQSNKMNFIGFLFCHVGEAHTQCIKNEKVAAFCTLAKNIDA